jgi:hypothetical protein
MAESTRPTGSAAWDPTTNATRAWAALRQRAHTDEERACIAAATHQADRVWIALHSGTLGPKAPTMPSRNAAWHRVALSEFELLRESGAYGHLAQLRPWACAAVEPVIAAWLNSPAPVDSADPTSAADAGPSVTVADRYGVGEAVNRINGDTQLSHLSTLLNAAQDAGVFGVPQHRVELVAAAGHRVAGTVARVVVDTPGGLALASEPLELAVLIDSDATGVDGATAALRRVADIATGLFVTHARAVWASPPPIPTLDRAATPVGRAFPELSLHRRAAPPRSPTPAPGPAPAVQPRAATTDTDRSTGRSR